MALTIFQTKINELSLMQTSWANQLNPLLQAAQGTGSTLPAGMVVAFAGTAIPDGWLLCNGAQVSRSQYGDLFSAIGTAHGKGDGQSTFNLPDYRGRFLRMVTGASANDPDASSRSAMNTGGNTGNNVGSVQSDQYASHNHPTTSQNYTTKITNQSFATGVLDAVFSGTGIQNTGTSGGNETRAKNAYVNYIIKT